MGSISKAGRSFLSQIGKQSLARNAPLRPLLPAVAIKRCDSIFTKYREPPNGFLFNEKPLKPGEKREWEEWEAIWYVGWGVAAVLAVFGVIYKPEPAYFEDAKQEAARRIAEIDARDAAMNATAADASEE